MSENIQKGHLKQTPSGPLAPVASHREFIRPQDPYMITNKDPNREYRFVSRAYLDKNGGFDQRGWEPITKANSKGEALVSAYGHTSTGGTEVRSGDLVLAFMPKERMEQKRASYRYRQDLMRSSLNRLRSHRNNGVDSMDIQMQRDGKVENLGF